jgi:hypothetical protein
LPCHPRSIINERTDMDSVLVHGASASPWDDALMLALQPERLDSPSDGCMAIGVENAAGDVYRIVRTAGINETVRLFESARDLGFGIGEGRQEGGEALLRVLRRPQ